MSHGNGVDETSVFDNLDALRLPLDDLETGSVREVLTTVPVRKPPKDNFVRAHPDPSMSMTAAIFEDKDGKLSGETYFVHPSLRAELDGLARNVTLITAITRTGVTFLWPVPLSVVDGRRNEWAESARVAAELAKSKWVRVIPDMALGGYRTFAAQGKISDPEWRDETFQQLVKLAFRDRVIDKESHPVLRRLRGLA